MTDPKGPSTTGVHHVAFTTRDPEATYDSYAKKLEMPLLHTENHLQGDGYFRHFFFGLGGEEAIAFFELHGVGEETEISTGLGTPALGEPYCVSATNPRRARNQDRTNARARDRGDHEDRPWLVCVDLYARSQWDTRRILCDDG